MYKYRVSCVRARKYSIQTEVPRGSLLETKRKTQGWKFHPLASRKKKNYIHLFP